MNRLTLFESFCNFPCIGFVSDRDFRSWSYLLLKPLPCSWLVFVLWSNKDNIRSLPRFWCACSACTEKPKETIRRQLWTFGSETYQHGTVRGFTNFPGDRKETSVKESVDSLPFSSHLYSYFHTINLDDFIKSRKCGIVFKTTNNKKFTNLKI